MDAPVRAYLVAIAIRLLIVKMSLKIQWVGERKRYVAGYPENQRTRREQRNDE